MFVFYFIKPLILYVAPTISVLLAISMSISGFVISINPVELLVPKSMVLMQ
jgi:hypothetical protein